MTLILGASTYKTSAQLARSWSQDICKKNVMIHSDKKMNKEKSCYIYSVILLKFQQNM